MATENNIENIDTVLVDDVNTSAANTVDSAPVSEDTSIQGQFVEGDKLQDVTSSSENPPEIVLYVEEDGNQSQVEDLIRAAINQSLGSDGGQLQDQQIQNVAAALNIQEIRGNQAIISLNGATFEQNNLVRIISCLSMSEFTNWHWPIFFHRRV